MDAERRAAGRRSEASGDVADGARLLVTRLRAGELAAEQVELMAYVGDPAAAAAVELGPLPEYPVSPATGERPGPGGWHLGEGKSRALGLWIDELVLRFGAQVGVRAALLAVQRAGEASRAPALERRVKRAHDAAARWLERPDETRARACGRVADSIGECGEEPWADDLWAALRLCRACESVSRHGPSPADLVFCVSNAADSLAGTTGSPALAEAQVRQAIRTGLVAWAETTREVVRDGPTLAARSRSLQRTDPRAALDLAERALANARANAGPKASIDPALLVLRAESHRAAGDLAAALGDVDGALAISDWRHSPALRLRGLVQADLARVGPNAEQAVHERHAVADLEAYLDRVLVQVTTPQEGTRLLGPPEAEEAKEALARLKGQR